MAFNIHALCDTTGRRQVAWYMVMLHMQPPCQWSEISFSVPRFLLLLKSISSAQVIFTCQPTAEQFVSFTSWKMPSSDKHVFFTRPWHFPFLAEAAPAITGWSHIFATYHQGRRRHCWPSAEVLAREIPKTTDDCTLALPLQSSHPSLSWRLVYKLEESELASTAPGAGAWHVIHPSYLLGGIQLHGVTI